MKSMLMVILILTLGFSQEKKPQASPRATNSQMIGLTKVTIDYGRPAVKGRTIFGDLEKFDKVWRTGANEQTEIEFSTDVMLNGKKVAKGRYSLFTIPKKGNKWTVILNKDLGQWGAYAYKEANDLMRFEVDVMTIDNVERLEFSFDTLTLSSGHLVFKWADKSFRINIEVM